MARSRNLKPGFFTNDVLGELPPLARLLFAGLWTLCDRDGRCEDRPKKIKAEVLPYDECGADALLSQLAHAGFIDRYEAEGRRVIQVVKWDKHQNPHVKEAPSTLPARCADGASPVQEPGDAQPRPERTGLIPSFLIPSSLVPDSLGREFRGDRMSPSRAEVVQKAPKAQKRSAASPDNPLFATFWEAYPRKDGKKEARNAFDKTNPSEETVARMLRTLKRQVSSADWLKDGGKFIPYPATWLNGERWADEGVQIATQASDTRRPVLDCDEFFTGAN
jgi:hypothetical protein